MAQLSDRALAVLCGVGVVFLGLNLTLVYLAARRQMDHGIPWLWNRQENEVKELHRRVAELQEDPEPERLPPAQPRPPA
jgi:hypothetical protein